MRLALLLPPLALAIAGCGPKELALPEDPVDRAATCGVVTAANARVGTATVEAPLTLAQQGQIMHYALLAGAEGDRFDRDRAAAVAKRMPALEGGITGENWQPLVPACAAAYPATAQTTVTLPAGALDAQLACYALADFLGTALMRQEADYGERLREYTGLKLALDARIGSGLKRTGQGSANAARDANAEALSAAAKLGPPVAVMDACLERFD